MDVGQFDDASEDEEELDPVINELRAPAAAGEARLGEAVAPLEPFAAAAAASIMPTADPTDPFRRLAIQQMRVVAAAKAVAAQAATPRGMAAQAAHRPSNTQLIAMDIARMRQQESDMMRRLQTTQCLLRQQQLQERQKLLARTAVAGPTVDLTQGPPVLGDTSEQSNSSRGSGRREQPLQGDISEQSSAKLSAASDNNNVPKNIRTSLDHPIESPPIETTVYAAAAAQSGRSRHGGGISNKNHGTTTFQQKNVNERPAENPRLTHRLLQTTVSKPKGAGGKKGNQKSSTLRHRKPLPMAQTRQADASSPASVTSKKKRPPVLLGPPAVAAAMGSPKKKKGRTPREIFYTIAKPPIEGAVVVASRRVGNELRYGLWPSPFCSGVPQDGSSDLVHQAHMKTVATALENFAKDVVFPSMVKSCGNKKPESKISVTKATSQNCCESRPFVGTLIALREVMTQNALNIFGKQCLSQAISGAGTSASQVSSGEKKEEVLHGAKMLATAVTVAAIESYTNDVGNGDIDGALEAYFKTLKAYDQGDEEFASHLQPDRGNVRGVLPNGEYLGAAEDVARSVSFNRARKRHPLVVLNEEKKLSTKKRRLFLVPETNVCHVAIFEDK